MNRQRQQQEQQDELDEQPEHMPDRPAPEQRNQVHDQLNQDHDQLQQDGENGGRQRDQNFLDLTPQQQCAWLRTRFDWCFAVAEHFEPTTFTTVEIAIKMLCDYMHSNRLRELPMDHVMRCSTAACLRMAMLLNEYHYVNLQELIAIGENRFSQEEIFESEFHIYRCLGQGILSPESIEYHAYNYIGYLESDGNEPFSDLWQPLQRLVRLGSRDLLFLYYPAQTVGLSAVILTLQLYRENSWGTYMMTLYRSSNIDRDAPETTSISTIINRLLILHHRNANEDEI